ncbi:pyruvate:ferredoxin (flavodoxin) oxidoreductase [Tengunoibacter tsumagoiensis]|uniref:Pyruvate-flavodoxin oxidoreductase n=1 Tax=Tengunoibacter tsumagoiensis TaxID=2014871 RepID=A0A402A673_9CHLR|nr:pyruvate:ferredoxin (flavodoxin) oxidoreductase [Tengunoibacter tsumagoiensis]GCE14630.1 pyruvate-flavodoxin oxidoreductase [Tengunoibacter tsumagoiensis]
MERSIAMVDGNEAVAQIAHALSEVMAIYPITPSTPMGELADAWSATDRPNLWGTTPQVIEMQSEAGAAGAIHGALQTGALATTFTASQGLLLMIPNMYKIAGELTPVVFHVAARSLATQGLSIFGDHSDVMATRATGFALLSSNSVQEAHDLALIAHASTLKARIPFLHFFDGFRTSHEINRIEQLTLADIQAMIDPATVLAHRARALSPDHPCIRGTAQNPDVYFQARETGNVFYQQCPAIVQETMDCLAQHVGRQYHLFDYIGAPDAERLIIIMGSGAETVEQTVNYLQRQGEKVGVVKVRLFRPFSVEHFLQALPSTVTAIAVLDRTKEPGSVGEPLYLDVNVAINEGHARGLSQVPRIIGGRYGLSSKEFTPAMVKAIYDELKQTEPKEHFTIGIHDDVTYSSLSYDPAFSIEHSQTVQCVFWGLGSDGTVGANKNSIKIIGEETENYAQGYFVYDSKKSGSVTISHLRFGPQPIHAPYLIGRGQADFVACHHFAFLERLDVLKYARPGGIFLLDSIYQPEEVWEHLPQEIQQEILAKDLHLYIIDAHKVAQDIGMGGRINTIMQTCFFAISRILSREEAIAQIKKSIQKTYSKRGETVVQQNFRAVDATLAHLYEVPASAMRAVQTSQREPVTQTASTGAASKHGRGVPLPVLSRLSPVPPEAPAFVRDVLGPMIAGNGDDLPVSKLPVDGTYPSGTALWEKRNLALEIPVWDPTICIQCGKCTMVCPHAVIRMKVYDPAELKGAPETFQSTDAHFKEFSHQKYTLQISPDDCTGCALCIEACPVKDKRQVGRKAINMAPQPPLRQAEKANWEFFLKLSQVDAAAVNTNAIKNAQLLEPLFEFSGACSGCGETPYLKLATQLFGDRMLVANATGCSSIYGGNLPTTPWTMNAAGRGPAWSNSLFEDNAEFGLGMRVTLDKQQEYACELLAQSVEYIGEDLVEALLDADQSTEAGIQVQRERVAVLKAHLRQVKTLTPLAESRIQNLLSLADVLVKKSVWIIGGDGWAFDIGFGGLDHVLASGRNVNILVLDTELYSNTGGQASKATPRAAVAKFAARGKATAKKDLGLLAMAYGSVYVAHVALGANDQQTLKAFLEAEAYDGPSLIIAYSHCIAHGIDMRRGLNQQKRAVQSGYWQLYRYNPLLIEEGKNPLILDSKEPTLPLEEFAYNEARYRMLLQGHGSRADALIQLAKDDIRQRWDRYQQLAQEEPPTTK